MPLMENPVGRLFSKSITLLKVVTTGEFRQVTFKGVVINVKNLKVKKNASQ